MSVCYNACIYLQTDSKVNGTALSSPSTSSQRSDTSLPLMRLSVGSLFHMADDLGRAMESLVNVMTDEQSGE
ncbi:unnamed protein product, partial [Coregonus sp. 'balchen']